MDDDEIQQDLLLGLDGRDRQALRRALAALLAEVAPIVARFERKAAGETVARVHDVVGRLMFPEVPPQGRRSKLLATDAELVRSGGARAHRRIVVRSLLLDDWRKRQTRREYERACAEGGSPEEIRAERRRRKQKQQQPAADVTARPGAAGVEPMGAADATDVALARQVIVRYLQRLKIEYRVAVALEEGLDVEPLVDELAAESREPIERLRERVAALRPGDDDARVRVLYPEDRHPDLAKARESYRKRHARGLRQLVELIRGDAS